jgi:hypothetical protein
MWMWRFQFTPLKNYEWALSLCECIKTAESYFEKRETAHGTADRSFCSNKEFAQCVDEKKLQKIKSANLIIVKIKVIKNLRLCHKT